MAMIGFIISSFISIFLLVLFITIVLSWLIQFNVINKNNQFVSAVWGICLRLTEPVLNPVRSVIPSFGGLDISPIVVFVLLQAVNIYIFEPMARGVLFR
jgi:YggT family protein